MKYDFRVLPEAGRAFVFGVIVYALTAVVALDGQDLTDWRRIVVSVLSGATAAGAAAALAFLTRAAD
jgi:hypothetical protein